MDNITSTPANMPEKDYTAPPLKYNADSASPAAAIDTTRTNDVKSNTMNNMHGGRGMAVSRRKKNKSSHTTRRGGGSRRRYRRRYSKTQISRMSRRLRMRMLQRRIKKRKNSAKQLHLQLQMRGGGGDGAVEGGNLTVPQHGHSCSPGELNCAGTSTSTILSASNQMEANSLGDTAPKPTS
jgi:hypothetical protein